MTARIYKPARTAMQSGTAKTKEWVLDYEPEVAAHGRAADGLDLIKRHEAAGAAARSRPRTKRSAIASVTASPIRCSRPRPASARASRIRTISPTAAARLGRTDPPRPRISAVICRMGFTSFNPSYGLKEAIHTATTSPGCFGLMIF